MPLLNLSKKTHAHIATKLAVKANKITTTQGALMKKFSLFQVPFLSFYSKEVYRDAAFNWKGVGLGYLFLLLVTCLVPQLIDMQSKFAAFMKNETPNIIGQIPEVIFTEGVASTQTSQPYIIKDLKTGKPFFVIDTTGTITNLDKTDGALGLLTKNEIIVKKSNVETRTFNFKDIKHYALNQTEISKWVDTLIKYAMLALSPFILIGSFVSKIIQVLIYGLVGMLFASICKTKLSYDALLRLSVVAISPGMVLNAFLQLTHTPVDQAGLLLFAMTMVYLFIGVQACTTTTTPTPDNILNT
jgi:hypothetical protein